MKVSLEELYPIMREVLDSGGEFSFITRGVSMMPMLRNGVDTIVLVKAPEKLKRFDIPLYRREDGSFVLHRIVGQNKDGYILIGDNQIVYEHGVKHGQVEAVAVAFIKDGVRYELGTFKDKLYICKMRFRRLLRLIKNKVLSR